MAPRGPAKARDYDYSNVGKLGRRTGISVKEGKRDEHGMEDIDGMWSSPDKSPLRENDFSDGNEASAGSDGMSMDEENAPGPADFLNGVNGGRNSYFPPPVARSPMKTGLTGSPRRTPGLRSSQSPQRVLPSSSPSDGKGLSSTKGDLRQDVSPLTNRSINAPPVNHLGIARNKANKNMSEITASFSDSDANSKSNGDENADLFHHVQGDLADSFDAGDDPIAEDQLEDLNDNGTATLSPSISATTLHKKCHLKTGPQTKKSSQRYASRSQDPTERSEPLEHGSSQKRKRPGRPPKNQRCAGYNLEKQRPLKKPKTSDKRSRDSSTSGHADLDKIVENYVNRTGPLKGRSLYILKRETPMDNSTTHTRSGRVSVRPLAYWKNERCVYGDGEAAEGERYPLSTIKEIIRTEELEPEKRKTKKGRPSKKSRSGKFKDDNESGDDEDYIDPWEKEGGVLHGYIRKWDPEAQAGMDEEEVLDIAYAPSGIETRDVKGSSFRFAKLLSSPFLGSGIVELPSGGVKKPKNSKKMHMVFYVCHGRVQVDISGVQFSAGKGCVFQVPRGNYYSFANTHGKDARLFFTQGCVPVEGNSSAPGSASKNDTMEEEPTPQVERLLGFGKGRPKGKQKAGGPKAS
ncbi:kinetochore CENP-C fungal-like protein [Aspergillus coremiiformis]|uniref:CENP-C homolog n=1 Tax=Aspergillus coremiiformis TaxID=138285 RepID=A0A5N6YSH4_9EURO|nr:kinetochore CENP-C fungal-like protein [Aspergillus coremiiformis]